VSEKADKGRNRGEKEGGLGFRKGKEDLMRDRG